MTHRLTLAACCALGIIGSAPPVAAQKAPARPGASSPEMPFIATGTAGFRTCEPADRVDTSTTTIRIKIPKGFETVGNGRQVRVKSGAGAADERDEEDGWSKGYEVPGGSAEFNRNAFHVDLGELKNAGDPDSGVLDRAVVKVRIVLADKDYKFLETRVNGEWIRGVAYPKEDTDAARWFCQKPTGYITRTGKPTREKSVLTFFIIREKRTRPVSINLLIAADLPNSSEGQETPIILDPKVRNDG